MAPLLSSTKLQLTHWGGVEPYVAWRYPNLKSEMNGSISVDMAKSTGSEWP